MAKRIEKEIYGVKYIFQSVSPQWYYEMCDRNGITGGHRDTPAYNDELLKAVVIEPRDVAANGVLAFEEEQNGGLSAMIRVLKEIDRFLVSPEQSKSHTGSKPQSAQS